MKVIIFTFISIFSLFLCGCGSTTTTDPTTFYQHETESQLIQKARSDLKKHHYDGAVKRFQALDVRYPFGKYTKYSRLDVIYAYYQQRDYASALAAADRYIHLYPRDENVDYAYYMHGFLQLNEHQGPFSKFFGVDFAKRDLIGLKMAYKDFDMLVKYFPNSQYVPAAEENMVYIRNAIARHHMQVAEYYFSQAAYVGAINRAAEIVEHYQQTPSVPKALALMVKAYRKLNLNAEANDVLEVLQASGA